jgi:hypothetical protein
MAELTLKQGDCQIGAPEQSHDEPTCDFLPVENAFHSAEQ